MSDDVLKVGFIGFGGFSHVRLGIFQNDPRVVVSGFYDPHVDSSGEIEKYDDLDGMLSKVDAVLISVPPALAPGYVVTALSQEKHVFCEKPAAINYEELKVIEPYLDKNIVLAYGFNHRQHGSIRKIREIIDSGSLGDVLWMRGRYGKEVDENYKLTWRCNRELNGGGILIDQGIHLIDLMNEFSGGFDFASAVLSNSYLDVTGVEDNAFVNFASKSRKITASLHSTITQWRYLFSLEIFLENGSIILNGLRTNSGNYGDERLVVKPNLSATAAYKGDAEYLYEQNMSWEYEMVDFVDSCLEGRPYSYADYQDAKKVTKLIDSVYRSAVWI